MGCPICNSDQAGSQADYQRDGAVWSCPVCGRFELDIHLVREVNPNHLASYLFYNAFHHKPGGEPRYHSCLSEEKCAEYRKEYERGVRTHGLPVHMDAQTVENWYPKTFSEKIDKILLYLGEHEEHFREERKYSHTELEVLLFIDLHDNGSEHNHQFRDYNSCDIEARKMLKYLKDEKYISTSDNIDDSLNISLEPNGYKRIDELQRNKATGRDVLVAMEFSNKTKKVREAIRKGVIDAGYNPIIYDEVENNDYIMPELLKSIRDSKFVVADLSDHNNGAYFEEGYAMGIGKPVIQLCREGEELHFDAAQKNTIVWKTEEELSERLTTRIKATIE